jgi:hypothetical protein
MSAKPQMDRAGAEPASWRLQAGGCFAGALAYSVVRYHVCSDVPWSQFPLFTMNKVVSFTAAMLLGASMVVCNKVRARSFGLAAFAMALLHVLMSSALIAPANYPKLYEAGRFSAMGSVCILAGCVAMLVFVAPAIASVPGVQSAMQPEQWRGWQHASVWVLALTALHVTMLGWSGWWAPQTWPGGLPPISALSALVVAVPLAVKAVRNS